MTEGTTRTWTAAEVKRVSDGLREPTQHMEGDHYAAYFVTEQPTPWALSIADMLGAYAALLDARALPPSGDLRTPIREALTNELMERLSPEHTNRWAREAIMEALDPVLLQSAGTATTWQPIEPTVPRKKIDCEDALVFIEGLGVQRGNPNAFWWVESLNDYRFPTHWQSLPPAPTDGAR